ncbi:MAG: 2-succinyl-5-enolpyruvyl-6-hydroxy-3-cyclohexene-1-carboxylic-acid synthase [Aquiluna sp.]|nr:2-succinyl-5-enolpyruvyl-6-hydroxy-3-cyclohexene-1-carboxylic-acid synthase [Aquiluna sp.]
MTTPSQQFAASVVAELVAAGVKNFYLAPGARSQALAIAAGQLAGAGKLSLTVRLDERSLAFTALGRAMSTAEPSVIITTSGTAVANLHPAILEAHHSGVPLILLTADRPAELRGIGANQTTEQIGMFGNALRGTHDVPAPRPGSTPSAKDLVATAISQSLGGAKPPGPVQLNLQFVEPLSSSEPSAVKVLAGLEKRPLEFPAASEEQIEIEVDNHTVVIAGAGAGPAAVRFAEKANLPLFAEPSSGARYGSSAITNYVQGLTTELAGEIRRVVVFGKPTLSRGVIALIKNSSVYVAKSANYGNFDIGKNVIATSWNLIPKGVAEKHWLDSWKEFEPLSEPRATLSQAIWNAPGSTPILIGASNIIRVADSCLVPRPKTVFSSRGLSGIDGSVSTAIGIAQAGAGVRALIGDLTLFHDAGSMNISGLPNLNVQLIIGNDSGGEIFRKLEVAKNISPEMLSQLFLTPQEIDIEKLCEAYGWQYFAAVNLTELNEAMKADGYVVIDYKL